MEKITKIVIGQRKLLERLLSLTTHYQFFNILLRGCYGMGKTFIAMAVASMLGVASYALPVNGVVQFSNNHHVQVVDEIHTCRKFEVLYPTMEDHRYIFCTNLGSSLPESFLSRCFTLWLDDYSVDELAQIATRTGLCEPGAMVVAHRSKNIPRNSVTLAKEVISLCNLRGTGRSAAAVAAVLDDLGVDNRGFTVKDRAYLKALERGPMSRWMLEAVVGVDRDELNRMEASLVRMGAVRITSRGRELW